MQVILMKDVDTLGEKGEILAVADGYARNHLLPKRLAVLATAGSLKDREMRITRIRAQAERKFKEDTEKASKVTAIQALTLEANAGEGGRLFGAITTKELARVLEDRTGLEIDRKMLSLDNPINRVGEYLLTVKFSPKVSTTISIDVLDANAHAAFEAA